MEFRLKIKLHAEDGGVEPWDVPQALRDTADFMDNSLIVPDGNAIVDSNGVFVGYWEVVEDEV